MQYALNKNKEKIEETPSCGENMCPCCMTEVQAKCGQIKIWHWAHKNLDDCDPWHESETIWHREWKNIFPKDCREIVIGNHRVDVFYRGYYFEFQHSSISLKEMLEREEFYGTQLVWIIDKPDHQFVGGERLTKYGKPYVAFKWKWFSGLWAHSKRKLYIDFNNGSMLDIWSLYENGKGAGRYISKEEFKIKHKIYDVS